MTPTGLLMEVRCSDPRASPPDNTGGTAGETDGLFLSRFASFPRLDSGDEGSAETSLTTALATDTRIEAGAPWIERVEADRTLLAVD